MNLRWVEAWLYLVALLVAGMVALGGVTRLTGSGLSIVEWDLLSGMLPPLSDRAWEEAFAAYRQTPQYQQINAWMEIDDFRKIFWWEWLHRFAGRIVGLVYVVPLAYFAIRRALPRNLIGRLLLLLLLGGLQGAVGWWMVRSGLVERVSVAPLRLAVHLGLAFVILGLLLDTALLLRRFPRERRASLPGCSLLTILLALQVVGGALVAGTGAGRVYTDWPLFNGDWLPPLSLSITAWFADHSLVQLQHRTLGYLAVITATWVALASLRSGRLAVVGMLMLLALAVWSQAALGIATLMAAAPPNLALAHQMGAVVVFCLVVAVRRWIAGSPGRQGWSAHSIGI